MYDNKIKYNNMNGIFLLYFLLIFLLGLCAGSFLNCVIYRLEQGKNLGGRSFCPHCKKDLSWKELFPIFSFLFLGGKCMGCRGKISIQYPLVELATALVFILTFYFVYPILVTYQLVYILYLFYVLSALIIIFVYDLKHYEIPDKVLLPAIAITFLYTAIFSWQSILNYLLAVLVSAGFFLIIFLVSKGRGMGFGDVKLAVLMGLLLGLPSVLVALFIAFVLGAIMGVILMIFQRKGLKSEIPFGPFLVLGTIISLFWGGAVIQWYINFLQI